jgi:hypothetical protein
LEEDLSKFKLIEEGYSLVYKIRGFLGSDRSQTDLHRAALTISEGNYFNFFRHMDKLIPSYSSDSLADGECISLVTRHGIGKIG